MEIISSIFYYYLKKSDLERMLKIRAGKLSWKELDLFIDKSKIWDGDFGLRPLNLVSFYIYDLVERKRAMITGVGLKKNGTKTYLS